MSKINHFKYYKSSPEIIKLAIMYYVRFPLSLRNVEDILHMRGIDICHETVRYWWNKLGPSVAKELKKKKELMLRQSGDGIWMKSSSKLTAKHIIFGGQSTMKEQSLTVMFLNVAIDVQPFLFLRKRSNLTFLQKRLSPTN